LKKGKGNGEFAAVEKTGAVVERKERFALRDQAKFNTQAPAEGPLRSACARIQSPERGREHAKERKKWKKLHHRERRTGRSRAKNSERGRRNREESVTFTRKGVEKGQATIPAPARKRAEEIDYGAGEKKAGGKP